MKKNHILIIGCLISVFTLIVSCEKLLPPAPADDELLDGPVEGLTTAQSAQFLAGDVAFNDEIFTRETGLGPIFVATSCGSCHAGDGKGHPFSTLTRFGINDSLGKNEFDNGPQLQNRALPGYMPEQLPPGTPFAKFTPPANTGLGFLELVSEDDILAMAAANNNNPDGVRGRPNWSTLPTFVSPNPNSYSQNGRYITRFGKKAATFNLFHQTVQAYNQDIGITSTFNPSDVYSHADIDPEVSDKTVRDVIFYLQTLKAPIQRTQNDADVIQGGALFTKVGCESCHKQTLKTGFSPVEALSKKEFHPYTDLLLHDMGPGLDDGLIEGTSKTSEWRTPPLWGLGLSKNSQGGKYFLLHDGRAKSIDEAIQMHGGEAATSKKKFNVLNAAEKQRVIKFLESL
ncbi:MAG TPA: di-heme oxidoredictase family protein [Sphingobacteriaceae bacterium]|nr:di-heme oxidoredictase family protein [Sphingobacteriaceae bacterium]